MLNFQDNGIVAYQAGMEQKLTGNAIARAIGYINPMAAVAVTTTQVAALTASQISPLALVTRSNQGGAFTETFPTAADLTATFPDVDLGQTVHFIYSNVTGQTATFTTNTGITLTGVATCASAAHNHIALTKTSAIAWAIQVV